MAWRLACVAAGSLLAGLMFLALPGSLALPMRVAATLGAGVLPLATAEALRRRWGTRDDRLLLGSTGALAVIAVAFAGWAGWRPGPLALALAAVVWVEAAIVLEAWLEDAVSWTELVERLALHGLLPLVLVVTAAIVGADLAVPDPSPTPERAIAVYDLDAGVATLPRPDCPQRLLASRVLLDRGAHPRIAHADGSLWFDAVVEGRRQIHRRDAGTGRVRCWTCDEPGNNRRPAVSPDGLTVVFDTDRWRREGRGSELHRISGRSAAGSSTRLTRQPGADERAVLGPDGRIVAWSRLDRGRSWVASASVVSGHGGVLLGAPGALAAGGSAWVAPLAWSVDARSLVYARGNPLGDLEARSVDPATGEERTLAFEVSRGPAGLSGDGGWLAIASGERMPSAGVLPPSFGTLLAPRLAAIEGRRALLRRSRLSTGPVAGPLLEVPLGEIERWGEPTGVALDATATRAVLGQRRHPEDGGGERLVELELACADS